MRFFSYCVFQFFFLLRPVIRWLFGWSAFWAVVLGLVLTGLNLLNGKPDAYFPLLMIPLGFLFAFLLLSYDMFLMKIAPAGTTLCLPI
jgi:hypothetical protein